MKALLQSFGLVAVGGLFGAVCSLALASNAAKPAPKHEASEANRQASAPRDNRVDALEARLALIESRQQIPAAPSASSAANPAQIQENDTPEGRKAEFWEKVRQSVREHNAEPLDAQWAAKTNSLLNVDLSRLASSNHFSVVSVDCRNTTCLSKVRWQSTGEALNEYGKLLHEPYQANCERNIVLDEDPAPDGRQEATMLFECESWRADGEPIHQQPIPK
jgi:hypothetical protein